MMSFDLQDIFGFTRFNVLIADLNACTLLLCSRSMYLALCWGLWNTWSWNFWMVTEKYLFSLLLIHYYILWTINLQRLLFFYSLYLSGFFFKKVKIRCPYVCEFTSGSSIRFHWMAICFYTNTMWFLLLYPCSTASN